LSKPLTRMETLRAMRISTVEGMLATTWLTLTLGVIPQGFALYLGASSFQIGLLGALQAIAGISGLFGAYLVEERTERRRFVAFLSGGPRAAWFILAIAALFLGKSLTLGLLLVLMAASWITINLAIPAWFSIMNDLVPERRRGRYYSKRNVAMGIVALIASPLAGRFLDVFQQSYGPRAAYATLFAIAGVLGAMNLVSLLMQPEPPKSPSTTRPSLSWEFFREPLHDKPFARFLRAYAFWVLAQGVAGPFFAVYMLKGLEYSFLKVQLINGFALLVQLLVAPVAGYLIDKYGNRALYTISYLVFVTVPLYFAFTDVSRPTYTLVLIGICQFLVGVFSAAFAVSQMNLMLGLSPKNKTAVYTSVWSTVVGLCGFTAPLLGGIFCDATAKGINAFGMHFGPYQLVFMLSFTLRLMVIPFLRGISEPQSDDVKDVLGRLAGSKPLRSFVHLRHLAGSSTPGKRAAAAQALGRMREPLAFEDLVVALNDPVLPVRRQAAIALGELGDERAVEPLLEALNRPGANIRIQVAVALGRLGDQRAVPALLKMLQEYTGKDPAFVQTAAHALGKLHSTEARETLLEIAEEADHPARAAAIQSLGDLGEQDVAAPLTEIMRSDDRLDPEEVGILGNTLAKLGDPVSVEPILARLSTAEPLLRRELANSLAAIIGDPKTLYGWLAMDEYAREEAVGQMLTGHLKEMRKARNGQAARRIEAAVEALGVSDHNQAVRHLDIASHKARIALEGTAATALDWIAVKARERDITEEEALVALYAFDCLLRLGKDKS